MKEFVGRRREKRSNTKGINEMLMEGSRLRRREKEKKKGDVLPEETGVSVRVRWEPFRYVRRSSVGKSRLT